MTPAQQWGRADGQIGVLSWRARANLTLVGMAVGGVVSWHLALVAVSDGLGIGDWDRTLATLVKGHPLDASPHASGRPSAVLAVTVWALLVIALFAAYVAFVYALARRRARSRATKGMADTQTLRAKFGQERARRLAAQSRPGMTARQIASAPLGEVGWRVGQASDGSDLVIALEDHVLVVAPTGLGKSSQVLIPAALTAPGALIVTSTRADVLDVIAQPRSRTGRVWVFDPLGRVGWPQAMVWDPVEGCQDARIATSRAMGFAAGLASSDAGNAVFFEEMATQVLACLLHAAALAGGTIEDVLAWTITLTEDQAQEAQRIIAESTDPRAQRLWAGLLRGAASGADETVSSTRMQLQREVRALADHDVLRIVTPQPGVPAFDARAFVTSTDTLVLISDHTAATNVGPLTAMLFQELVDEAKHAALRLPGGRIDPPTRVVGDEITNIAPIKLLPDLASDLRGYGWQLFIGVQSDAQIVKRWGTEGARVLTGNLACEIALPGIRDTKTLERLSQLVGSVDVQEITASFNERETVTGQSMTVRERRVLRPEEIRTMPDGKALVVFRNAPPTIAALTPWYQLPDSAVLTDAARATAQARAATPRR